jgi:hypothetical protein
MSDDEQAQGILGFMGRHLIALTTTRVQKMSNGDVHRQFFAFSGCVLRSGGDWAIVTAGHVLHDLRKGLDSKQIELLEPKIVDYVGAQATNRMPIPFPFMEQPYFFLNEDRFGIDFAVIQLTPVYRALLQANGVSPFGPGQWQYPEDTKFYAHFILGFPSEMVKEVSVPGGKPVPAAITMTMVPVEELPDDGKKLVARFRGRIHRMGGQDSLDGMSGGPIIGISEKPTHRYWIKAIQSEWNRGQKITYGCPIRVLAECVRLYAANQPTPE